MSTKKGGFFSSSSEDHMSTAASSSTLSVPNGGGGSPESKSLLTKNGSGPGISAETAKDMCEKLHKEIWSLEMTQENEQERIDIQNKRHADLTAAHEKTLLKLEQKKALLSSLEEPAHTSLRIKDLQVKDAQRGIEETKIQIKDFEIFVENQRLQLKTQLGEFETKVVSIKKEIYYIEQRLKHASAPPGPYALKFLDSDGFQLLSAMVIMCNLLVMYLQFTDKDMHFRALNLFFLTFYVVELVVQLVFKQGTYFYSAETVHWWNILDFSIVVIGVVEFLISIFSDAHSPLMSGLRVLRSFRLARAAKIVHMFAEDMTWADSHAFHFFMMAVIALNTLTMGLETEFEGLPIWKAIDTTFLFIYTFEILVNLRLHGLRFFYGDNWYWNLLDFTVVGGGIVYVIVLPGIASVQRLMGMHPKPNTVMEQFMAVLRMFRLLRILRLGKLIRQIPPLYTLVIGIAKAMQGMGWVLVLTLTVLYTCALVGVKLVGKGAIVPEDEEEVRNTFKDIPEAIFNLFKVMNADLGGVEPLLNMFPISKYIMMLYMIVTNWAIFSILTAVVSDNMAKVTDAHSKEEEEEEKRVNYDMRQTRLEMLFNRLDVNHDGNLNVKEFTRLCKDEENAEEIERLTGVNKNDFEDFFDLISKKTQGSNEDTISTKEFLTMLDQQCETVTLRSMMKIERRLASIEVVLQEVGSRSQPTSSNEVEAVRRRSP